ncbi:related to PRI2-DNA-directed DNA polymerase alpha, 58 KD subunit (DNA primase) [Serendipita indica DSM 11827]|uniref:DNA primase large subunit n=1 Tax=Serendipita indica (strain DSM 11827) TaxID=1109443 RepID=G4TR28_SERID|nr:related to PRI2-DNA-directed DNA polymerase alpha, 58 KD subunit (DNA primase) [Serendipita indica DSM 11827]
MAALTARRGPVASTSTKSSAPLHVENHFQPHYPYRLNFYDTPPQFDVTLEQFESWGLDRLRILAEIESSFVRNRAFEELKGIVNTQQKKYLTLNSNTAINADKDAERKKDHVSHFVLRLAFCRSEDLRRRFIKAEMALFKVRWETDDPKEREEFLKARAFGWGDVSDAEKAELEPHLKACLNPKQLQYFPQEKYYKVPWSRVPDLVHGRRVYLRAGAAYVPSREQSSIVFQQFQADLEEAMEMTARALPRMDEDRLTPILDHLSKGFLAGVASEYSAPESGESVTADMIDGLAKKHFPLCMRALHEHLRKESHLRHQGRLQYGLFLKIVGLSIEEALAFWRKAFSGKMSDEKFTKEHLYNIKHNYGLVGKMANYPARSCQTILTTYPPGANEFHGCPYRHYSEDNLKTALQSMMGISSHDMQDVLSSVRTQHYHVACTRVYELTHGIRKGEGLGGGETVNHPNEYCQRSRELEKSKNAAAADDAMKID